jgi:hypothetical protein
MGSTPRLTCRVCGSSPLVPVIDLGAQFLQGAFIKPDGPPPPMDRYPTSLLRCDASSNDDACGLLQISHSVQGPFSSGARAKPRRT